MRRAEILVALACVSALSACSAKPEDPGWDGSSASCTCDLTVNGASARMTRCGETRCLSGRTYACEASGFVKGPPCGVDSEPVDPVADSSTRGQPEAGVRLPADAGLPTPHDLGVRLPPDAGDGCAASSSWSLVSSPTRETLRSVSSGSWRTNAVYAVGDEGTVLRWRPGGDLGSWAAVSGSVGAGATGLRAVATDAVGDVVIVGDQGSVFSLRNSVGSGTPPVWHRFSIAGGPALRAAVHRTTRAFALAAGAVYALSLNAEGIVHRTNELAVDDAHGELTAVECVIDTLAYAVRASGTILRWRSTEGWRREESCVAADLLDVGHFMGGNDGKTYFAVGAEGTILQRLSGSR